MTRRNRCICRDCGDLIESKHRHDFVRCKCGRIFTDGGTAYTRRGFKEDGDIIDVGDADVVFGADGKASVLP